LVGKQIASGPWSPDFNQRTAIRFSHPTTNQAICRRPDAFRYRKTQSRLGSEDEHVSSSHRNE
jgi:hypothetical protein